MGDADAHSARQGHHLFQHRQCVEKPKAARAIGAAVGKNPMSFVVPCHRVLGKNGDLTGYHWGLTRASAHSRLEAGQLTKG